LSTIVQLPNNGPVDAGIPNLYYPRLQVNPRGEIVLATGKRKALTTGICVGYLPGVTTRTRIGQKFDDWEVGGELVDYDGEVTVTLTNNTKKTAT
jgi:hypothetical protein